MIFWEQFNVLLFLNLNYLKQFWESEVSGNFSYYPGLKYSSILCAHSHLSLVLTLVRLLD